MMQNLPDLQLQCRHLFTTLDQQPSLENIATTAAAVSTPSIPLLHT